MLMKLEKQCVQETKHVFEPGGLTVTLRGTQPCFTGKHSLSPVHILLITSFASTVLKVYVTYVQTAPTFFLSNHQSEYSVFHKLMCWQSLTFRLSNVMSLLQRGDLLYHISGLMRGLKPKFTNYPDQGHHGDSPLSGGKPPW
jgi:hypothetical protein